MLLQSLHNPDVALALVIFVVVLALILVITLNRRSDARLEFLLGLMKDLPKDGHDGSRGSDSSAAKESGEESGFPVPRNIDF